MKKKILTQKKNYHERFSTFFFRLLLISMYLLKISFFMLYLLKDSYLLRALMLIKMLYFFKIQR